MASQTDIGLEDKGSDGPEVKDQSQTNMAATEVEEVKVTNVCLVCLEEADHLKVVGECHHAFCEPCLQKHLAKNELKEKFYCPYCHANCTIPADGVESLPDFVPTVEQPMVIEPEVAEENPDDDIQDGVGDVEKNIDDVVNVSEVDAEVDSAPLEKDCSVCNLKGATHPAKRYCEQCDMYLCEECCHVHNRKASTKNHALTALGAATRDSAGVCRRHGLLLKMYCRPCAMPCCGFCIEIDHEDHGICPVRDILADSIASLETVFGVGASMMQDLEMEEAVASVVGKAKSEWKATVVRAVEEKAEKCISNILEQKNRLLKTIREDCSTVAEEKSANDAAKVRRLIRERLDESRRLISGTTAEPKNLKRLKDMKATIDEAIHQGRLLPKVAADCERPVSFVKGKEPVRSIGSVSRDVPMKLATEVLELQLPETHAESSIPEIRCLGEKGFAAICRPKDEASPDVLLTYDMDGELKKVKNAKSDHPRVAAMDVDADNRLVLLLPSKADGMFQLKVHDTVTETSTFSKEFPLSKPLSMAISPEGLHYILSEGREGIRVLTAVDRTGTVTEAASIAYPVGVRNHTRVVCNGEYIYTMGPSMVAIFGVVGGKITFLSPVTHSDMGQLRDITTSVFDDTLLVIQSDGGGKQISGSPSAVSVTEFTRAKPRRTAIEPRSASTSPEPRSASTSPEPRSASTSPTPAEYGSSTFGGPVSSPRPAASGMFGQSSNVQNTSFGAAPSQPVASSPGGFSFGRAASPAAVRAAPSQPAAPTIGGFSFGGTTAPSPAVRAARPQPPRPFYDTNHRTNILDIQPSAPQDSKLIRVWGVKAGGRRIHTQNHTLLWTDGKTITVYKLRCGK